MSGSQPPGWYPAPGSPTVQRWWDGNRWTGEVREADNAGGANAPSASTSVSGWRISWPGSGASPVQPAAKQAKQAKRAKQAPEAAPEPPAEAEAAWRAPAVEGWEARTDPERSRKLTRRRGWTKYH